VAIRIFGGRCAMNATVALFDSSTRQQQVPDRYHHEGKPHKRKPEPNVSHGGVVVASGRVTRDRPDSQVGGLNPVEEIHWSM
jgi:hypothetical protein